MSEPLQVEMKDRTTIIRIDREPQRNALNDEAVQCMQEELRIAQSRGARCVVITGVGKRAFSSGSDIKELVAASDSQRSLHTSLGHALLEQIEEHPAPVIAAIEGYCLGGGLELALACDLRVAGSSAVFGLPETKLSALPVWGATFRLARVVGIGRAKEMILFGRRLEPSDALSWGLIAEVVPAGSASKRALEVAAEIAETTDPETIARAKALVTHSYGVSARTGAQLEYFADAIQTKSEAFRAGMANFIERRTET